MLSLFNLQIHDKGRDLYHSPFSMTYKLKQPKEIGKHTLGFFKSSYNNLGFIGLEIKPKWLLYYFYWIKVANTLDVTCSFLQVDVKTFLKYIAACSGN